MSGGLGHISVKQLRAFLAELPEELHIAPTPGTWSIAIWDGEDNEVVGDISRQGGEFVLDLWICASCVGSGQVLNALDFHQKCARCDGSGKNPDHAS